MKYALYSAFFFILTVMLCVFETYGQKSQYKCFYQFDMLKDTIDSKYFRQEIYIVQIGEHVTKGFTYQKFYNDSLENASPEMYRKMFSTSFLF